MKLSDISKGVVIGARFRLVDILGRGSYGTVWLADIIRDESGELPSQVAIKIFHHQDSGNRYLFQEAQQAKDLTGSDRLVRVFDAARIDGLAIMWMEYVPGQTLHQIVGDGSLPEPIDLNQVLAWLRDIAEGLAFMHMQDPPRVHGDLKLDNAIVDPQLGVRLADFGQSRPIEDRFVDTDGAGAWPYLAPEILDKSIDGRGKRFVATDIYAFGVIAYKFLTGRFPRRTMGEAIHLKPFPRAIHVNASVPPELDAIVSRCLEKRPQDRFETGAALLAAIEKLQAEVEIVEFEAPEPDRLSVPTVTDQLTEMARELLDKDQVDEVIARLEKAMERMSTSPQVLVIYGEAARRVGKFEAAHMVYTRAIRWMEQHGRPIEDRRDAVEGLAEVNVQLKRYEDAVEQFRFLAENWDDRRWYQYRYAVALGLEGATSAVRKSIDILRAMYDEEPSALVASKTGLAYHQLGNTDLATRFFNEALMIDEYEPTALFHLARIRAIQGKPQKAIEYLRRLEQIDGAEDLAVSLAQTIGA
ncbi:Serine/threonine-protein kinase Pkn1 [Maioricimonas rarisocia]|uniref:Serine/threonine-protein kinase Pkn1 n=1 Tax=Maioricimonas rarisocia TaxID=2528026 RepID=A0A517Z583_9PLAN|nr:serine/threonine-protein kinase [Maioricimonas rarisocia]QDU37636.1 Serine/threonine-protein kinase Pkn1 [Maioricimonas rarisocia]